MTYLNSNRKRGVLLSWGYLQIFISEAAGKKLLLRLCFWFVCQWHMPERMQASVVSSESKGLHCSTAACTGLAHGAPEKVLPSALYQHPWTLESQNPFCLRCYGIVMHLLQNSHLVLCPLAVIHKFLVFLFPLIPYKFLPVEQLLQTRLIPWNSYAICCRAQVLAYFLPLVVPWKSDGHLIQLP